MRRQPPQWDSRRLRHDKPNSDSSENSEKPGGCWIKSEIDPEERGCRLLPDWVALDILGFETPSAVSDLEIDELSIVQRPESLPKDRRMVDEHFLSRIKGDEPETFFAVKPFDSAASHNALQSGCCTRSGSPANPGQRFQKRGRGERVFMRWCGWRNKKLAS
jgi:hypothetical protein